MVCLKKKSEIWCSSCADHSDPMGGGKSLPRPSPKFSHMEEIKLMALWKSMTIWNFGHIGHAFGYVICLYIFRHAVPRCDSCLVPWPNPINIEKNMCDHLWISRSFQLISIMPFSCWAECWNGENRLCTLVASQAPHGAGTRACFLGQFLTMWLWARQKDKTRGISRVKPVDRVPICARHGLSQNLEHG